MLIVQIMITFTVGVVATLIVIATVTGLISFGSNENIEVRIRVIGIGAIGLLMSYLIGLIVVSALGGYYGLSELLR